jgi:hypothetical protein
LNRCGTTLEALPDSQRASIQAARRQVLAKRSGIHRKAQGRDPFKSFGGHQQDGAFWNAVELRVPPAVPCDTADLTSPHPMA